MTKQIASTSFEQVTCGRCGGSGHYSYNQINGTTCFGCNGKGKVLTKRAQAAVAWLREQRTISASDVVVGQRIKTSGLILTVRAIETEGRSKYMKDGQWHSYVTFKGKTFSADVFPDSKVELVPATEAERVAQVRAALAYQDTLTKTGKERK